MSSRIALLTLSGSLGLLLIASPALAVSDQECAAKFKAAEDNKTLAGQGYDEFRKIQCGGPAGTKAPSAVPGQAPTIEPSHQGTPTGTPAPNQG